MTDHAADVEQLSFSYGRRVVLERFDIRIPMGVSGILGPNGAGKSTLLALLASVTSPQTGRVSVLGCDLGDRAERDEARLRMGYLPQRFGVIGSMTVRESVEYSAWLHGVDWRGVRERAADAIALVDLTDEAALRVRKLSGGMRQRLGIAQVVAHRPELLLLDEPTAGLDPMQRLAFRQIVRRLGEEGSVILSSHMVDDIEQTCSHVVVMHSGRVGFEGSVDELAAAGRADESPDPQHATEVERGYAAVICADSARMDVEQA